MVSNFNWAEVSNSSPPIFGICNSTLGLVNLRTVNLSNWAHGAFERNCCAPIVASLRGKYIIIAKIGPNGTLCGNWVVVI